MRISELTKHKTVRANMQQTSKGLQDAQIALSNGKKLNKPSDDPVGAAMVQDYRTSINRSQSVEKNIMHDMVWLNKTESAIKQLAQSMMHVKDLALQGANGASTAEEKASLADEISVLTKGMVKLGNAREGKLYLFAGTKTFTEPLRMNPRVVEADALFSGSRIKSEGQIIPLSQGKPMVGIKPGILQLQISNPNLPPEAPLTEDGPNPSIISIQLDGGETPLDILRAINEAAKAQEGYVEDPHAHGGYRVRMHAEMGIDNHIYFDPSAEMNIKVLADTTGFSQQMKFKTITGGEIQGEDGEITYQSTVNSSEYNATFKGWAKQPLAIKVIKGGSYGDARYIVSDDGGKNWSQPQKLEQQNEIYNPEGKASNKVYLQFKTNPDAFFREGLEFHFEGNEFIEYHGNDQIKYVPIDNGIKVALNITANELFRKDENDPNTVNSFDVLNRLIESLYQDDQQSVMKSLEEIDLSVDQLLKWQGQVGTTVVELEASKDRLQESMDFKAQEISEIEDLDLAAGAIELNRQEVKNKVALDSAARLIQPSLINFLK